MLKILTVTLFGEHQVLTEIVSGYLKFISGIYREEEEGEDADAAAKSPQRPPRAQPYFEPPRRSRLCRRSNKAAMVAPVAKPARIVRR